ncbi:matrix metalloproteinase-25 [Aplochiton taeniatus]
MEFGILSRIILSTLILPGHPSPLAEQYTRGVDWLSRYGYLPPPDPRTSKLQTKEGIERAIRIMQRFGNLRETGRLDSDTLKLMATPRCSLPDIVGTEDMLKRRRRKRYTLSGLKWESTNLTWSIHSYPSSVSSFLNPDLVKNLLTHAFKAWSDVAPLRFRRLSGGDSGGGAGGDIRVSFSRMLHDDGYPFDGRGATLAHAFFPGRDDLAGDTHFDDDEIWTYGGAGSSTDLFTVAVHEFGHALGLGHSSSEPSIMRPYYQGPVGDAVNYRLPQDDIEAIRQLYGFHMHRADHADPDRCEGGFDAVANIRGEVFFFKGPHYWRIQRTGSLVSLKPALIQNFWKGLPPGTNKIDAIYERKSDSSIIFFIGAQYWVFKNTEVLAGYPRPLSDWGMRSKDGRTVDSIAAAFIWAHNGKTYLFGAGEFWRFDESRTGQQEVSQPEVGYPKDTGLWRGVPTHPDDIISWGDGDAYFFKDNLYWVLKRGGLDQDNVTPKSVAVDWLRCEAPIPTHNPIYPNQKDCNCDLKGDSAMPQRSWLVILSFTSISIYHYKI